MKNNKSPLKYSFVFYIFTFYIFTYLADLIFADINRKIRNIYIFLKG